MKKYKTYSDTHNLSLHNDRTQVYGFDKSQSMKTVWAEKKAAKKNSGDSSVSGGHAVTVNVPAPTTNGGTGKIYSDESFESISYMSKSFRPSYIDSNAISYKLKDSSYREINVKSVYNSRYDMITDISATKRDKAVRITEKLLPGIEKRLTYKVDMPQIAVVDFEKNGLNIMAIAGYDSETDILYVNSKYNTLKKIKSYVSENKGEFSSTTIYDFS